MKKVIIALAMLFGCAILAACSTKTAASGYGAYEFELENYNVEYDVSSECSIAVTEIINVHYLGYFSTGFYRDIPVNGGAQVKNISVTGVDLISGGTDVPYEVIIEDNDFITIDIGSTINKTDKNEIYRLTYDYCISNSVVKDGLLPLNPVGTGWDCRILNASVKVILPDGFQSAKCYIGRAGSTAQLAYSTSTENGRTVLSASTNNLNKYEGISFDINFEDGSIRPYADLTPYWFVLAAAVLLIVLIAVKAFVFNKDMLTPIVNFEAPNGMDPLIMGKLIDNKVNSEDVTSLIFYWADKGYLKINLDDQDNPAIIKIKNLPPTAEKYEQVVFNGLFKKGDAVKTSALKNNFYLTYNTATSIVNEKAKGLYKSSSLGVSVFFALLGGLLAGLAPLIIGKTVIHYTLSFFLGFIVLVPSLVLYVLTMTIMYNRLKHKAITNALFFGLLAVGAAVCSLIYIFIVPASLIPALPKFLICVLSFAIAIASVTLINRTKEYSDKLNNIVGFRNFILYAEKDRLEALLEEDPQYYYHVLPYAQVLNVSDIWEEKFKSITVEPPVWATYSTFDMMLDFAFVNSLIRHSMISLSAGMISRPSSSGMNGGGGHFGGGGFGGFSGGGFGGGGGRGR